MPRLKLAAGWVGVQLLFFVGWTLREQVRAASGPSILVKVVPVDPRDLLRGQYLSLAYEFSRPWDSTAARLQLPADAPVWVVLRRGGPVHLPQRLSLGRPPAPRSAGVAPPGRARGPLLLVRGEPVFVAYGP